MSVSDELRTRRVELDISQAALAAQLEVSQQTISRWEGGTGLPGPRRIVQLADALDLDLFALLRSAGYLGAWDLSAATELSSTQLGQLTTEELVSFIDVGWRVLRGRLRGTAGDPSAAP